MTRGVFIALEGIDGSGKSTVALAMMRSLIKQDKTCAMSYQPTSWFRRLNVDLSRMSNLEHIALFAADRGFDQEILAQEMDRYEVVIRDRYSFSSYAYSCTNETEIAAYEGLHRNFIKPDLTVLINTPVQVCLQRIEDRGHSDLDYFEEKNLGQVRDRYLRKMSLINYEKSLIVDGSKSVDTIVDEILWKLGSRMLMQEGKSDRYPLRDDEGEKLESPAV